MPNWQHFYQLVEVKKAIHVKENIHWEICSDKINYTSNVLSVIPIYQKLIEAKKYSILVYSGDVDGAVCLLLTSLTSGSLCWHIQVGRVSESARKKTLDSLVHPPLGWKTNCRLSIRVWGSHLHYRQRIWYFQKFHISHWTQGTWFLSLNQRLHTTCSNGLSLGSLFERSSPILLYCMYWPWCESVLGVFLFLYFRIHFRFATISHTYSHCLLS